MKKRLKSHNFKVGDIVKIDSNAILKVWSYIPGWYSSKKSFKIVNTNNANIVLDSSPTNTKSMSIYYGYLKLDVVSMRKEKLEKLYETKNRK